jgi:hypothetical protein
MQTPEIIHAIRSLLNSLQETKSNDFFELSQRLEKMRAYFDATALRIQTGGATTALDLDFKIDDVLALSKQVIRDIYKRADASPAKDAARAAYASATKLQWHIGEHDIEFSPRRTGYEAGTAEEVHQLLDRIDTGRDSSQTG